MNKTEETVMKLQEKTIQEIAEAIFPWVELPTRPMPIKLKNTTIGTHQIEISIEEGVVVIELKTRVANPTPGTLSIPTGDERIIKLSDAGIDVFEESSVGDNGPTGLGFGTEPTR